MNEILLRHLNVPFVMQQQLLVNDCREFQEKHSRGYGDKGFSDLVIKALKIIAVF